MIPAAVHDGLFACVMLSLLWSLYKRKEDFVVPLIVGMTFIFCYWNHARFPEIISASQYVVFHILEALVYLTSSLFLVRLEIKGAIETGRVYFFLFTYDLLLLLEYYVVNVKGFWSATYVYSSFELVGVLSILLITSFVLFGDWYNGLRRKRGMAVFDRSHPKSSVGHINFHAKK